MVDEVLDCREEVITPPPPSICEPICKKIEVVNGTYGSVTIVDGCIVDAQDEHLPVYTPPTCCDGDTGGGGGTNTELNILPDVCNLLKKVGGEYYVKPVFSNTSSATWSGCGTTGDPFELIIPTSETITINGFKCIDVTNTGNAYVVSHTSNPIAAGIHDGITVDECGHITDVNLDSFDQLEGKPGSAIVVTGGEISIQPSPAEGSYQLGGTTITVDAEGRVTAITAVPIPAGSFTTVDGKTVSFDSHGVITSVV